MISGFFNQLHSYATRLLLSNMIFLYLKENMNRRTILRNSLVLGVGAMFPIHEILAKMTKPPTGFHRFKLGTLEMLVVTDGHIPFPSVQPSFAPGIDSVKVAKLLHDNFLPEKSADLGLNVLMVQSANKKILVDSGCGSLFGESSGKLMSSLKDAGVAASDITDVVLTHAHPDHIGGLLDANNNPVFANADIYLSRIESEFWLGPTPDFSKSKMHNPDLQKMVTSVAKNSLAKLKAKIHLVEDGQSILGCIKLKLAPGHTPGHALIAISSNGEELVHTGDLVHSPVIVFAHPEWGFDGDFDFTMAANTRKNVLEDLAKSRKQVFSYHLPWPGLGHVRKKEQGYEWIAEGFAMPG